MLEKLVGFGTFLCIGYMFYSLVHMIVVTVKDSIEKYKNSEEE